MNRLLRHSGALRSEKPGTQNCIPDGRDRVVMSSWLPGPGFLGEYRLEFLSSQGELFQVVVEVSPERNEKEEVVCP